MVLQNQSKTLSDLHDYANAKRQSVIINGFGGCGKTYMAREYAEILHIPDFVLVEPKIDNVRSILSDRIINNQNPVLICIENIETGVIGVDYALLKFIEEPTRNTYVIVTTSNIDAIPDTILSRCFVSTLQPPSKEDLDLYFNTKYYKMYENHHQEIVPYARSYKQIDNILMMGVEQISYIKSLDSTLKSGEAVSSIAWKLQHYRDSKAETPIDLILEYLIEQQDDMKKKIILIRCLDALQKRNMSVNAILSKYIMEYKYHGQIQYIK